jgi:phage tail tape-measure protein
LISVKQFDGCIAVENIKIIAKIANGELSMQEGLYKMEEIAVAMIGGFVLMGKGAAIGGTVGLVFGPVGVAIGGFVGGTIGYMLGSKAGEIFVKTSRKIRNYVTNKIVEKVNIVKNKMRNFVSSMMFYKDVIVN